MIAAINFVLLPLTFLSSAFLQRPGARVDAGRRQVQPGQLGGAGGREALTSGDWGLRDGARRLLLAFAVVCALLATRAFAGLSALPCDRDCGGDAAGGCGFTAVGGRRRVRQYCALTAERAGGSGGMARRTAVLVESRRRCL